MRSLAQLGQVAVLSAAVFLGVSPSARASAGVQHDSQRARELERLQDLLTPLARAVLGSANAGELEATIEEQLFSGLFADVLARSVTALVHAPDDANELVAIEQQRIVDAVEKLGVERAKAGCALELSLFSSKLGRAIATAAEQDLELDGDLLSSVEELLYDPSLPVEISEACHADFESAICLIALTHAAERGEALPQWLVVELAERWLRGQEKSLPLVVALALEFIEELPEDLQIEIDQYLEHSGAPSLDVTRERTERYGESLRALAEHAERQADGVWPTDLHVDDQAG